MKPTLAPCPSCAAEISFGEPGTVVVVCEFCRSVVARTDRAFEDLGKVGDLHETGSAIQVGLRSRMKGKPFTIVGRTQIEHAAGGVWDEWYLSFRGGTWGWLAEAEGEFHLTTQKTVPGERIPAYEDLSPGDELTLPGIGQLHVNEVGQARYRSAEGQLPFPFAPGESFPYADLTGGHGRTVTIDYGGDTPAVYSGRKVELEELGLTGLVPPRERPKKTVSTADLGCPHCASPLELLAPDRTQRVVCPSCNSLLDTSDGKLQYLQTLDDQRVKPLIPLGSVGSILGHELTVIGFLQRGVKADGVWYRWQEYLLYRPEVGFRWLVENNGHWMFAEPLEASKVRIGKKIARYAGDNFRIFDRGEAVVKVVYGEFYWQVDVGEKAQTRDYISPPHMLSQEKSSGTFVDEDTGNEIEYREETFSLGHHLPVSMVQSAFGVKLRPPRGVGPIQPFPTKMSPVLLSWAAFVAALLLLFIVLNSGGTHRVFEGNFPTQGEHITAESFPMEGRKNIRIRARAQVDNSWVYVDGTLVNIETGLVVPFGLTVSYYHGSSGGERWSEGSRQAQTYLSSVPSGDYSLGVVTSANRGNAPGQVQIVIDQGVRRILHAALTFLALSILPLGLLLRRYIFETQRWKDSPYNPYSST